MTNKIKHFLNIHQLKKGEILKIIKKSHDLKSNYGKTKLKKKVILAMIFEKPSTRTRVAFEVGMKQLGGDVVVLDQGETQLGRGESLQDTIQVLSRYVDLIMYRGSNENTLYEMADHSLIPIINGLTDKSHPCQILADIMTLEEKFNSTDGIEICWVGDGNNVCNSWIHACSYFDFNFNISCPKGYFPKKNIIDMYNKKNNIKIFHNPKKAVENSDVIVTDTWFSMGMKQNNAKADIFKEFQVNEGLYKSAFKKPFFLHCLPAHREKEVTSKIIDGDKSLVWDEAENRLYVHQAIILWCLNKI